MSRFTVTVALAGALLPGILLAPLGFASAQTAPGGQFGQRTGSGNYVPSTHDLGCGGIICNPLPSVNASGRAATNPSEVAPPPPCEGLICGMTPYSMQRPYTASDAAAAEKARAAAQAQAAAQPAEPMAPARHVHKVRKAKLAKAARTPAPAQAATSQ